MKTDLRATMKMRNLLTIPIFGFAFSAFADTALDNFFANLPKDIRVSSVECSIEGTPVEPWRLDSYHIDKDSDGNWGITLTVDGSSVIRKITPQYGRYSISQNPGQKVLDVQFYQGPGLSLKSRGNDLELDLLYQVPQVPGPDLIRKCAYK